MSKKHIQLQNYQNTLKILFIIILPSGQSQTGVAILIEEHDKQFLEVTAQVRQV